jgi:hypothetical protein
MSHVVNTKVEKVAAEKKMPQLINLHLQGPRA